MLLSFTAVVGAHEANPNCSHALVTELNEILSNASSTLNSAAAHIAEKYDPVTVVNSTDAKFGKGSLKTLCDATCGVQLVWSHGWFENSITGAHTHSRPRI